MGRRAPKSKTLAVKTLYGNDAAFSQRGIFVSNRESPSAIERYAALAAGVFLLLVAASHCGWGVRLTLAGLGAAGWPPGLGQLLLPVGATALVIGFGAWRLLRMGLPARVGGLPLGWAVLATFGIAALFGALA